MSIIVTVEDHGVGVPEEMRETLFQPFRQAQRMTGGTGLGLYSLFKRVEALGGYCGVNELSDGTPGSSFWFSFPYRPDYNAVLPSSSKKVRVSVTRLGIHSRSRDQNPPESVKLSLPLHNSRKARINDVSRIDYMPTASTPMNSNNAEDLPGIAPNPNTLALSSPLLMMNDSNPVSEPPNPPPVPQSPQSNIGELRVLLTDDALTILKVCKRMLQTNGHAVQTAVNGLQSLEKLKTYYTNDECDVLLTDLQMPVMDGIECTKRFRAWEETQQCLLDEQGIPRRPRFLIVGMSANSDSQSKQEALDAGMDYFHSKPFVYEDFETIIMAHESTFGTHTSFGAWGASMSYKK